MTGTPPLGVQLYSVRDDIGPDQLVDTLGRLASMGFTHVEPYDILSDTEGLAAALEATGLRAATAHSKITELDADAVLAAASRLGISTIIVPFVPPESIADEAGVRDLAAAINAAAALAATRGIRVGYHNHDFEFSTIIDGVSAYERLVAQLDPAVVLEVDVYWASVGGADVFELLPRLADRVRYLHVMNQASGSVPREIRGVEIRGRLAEILALSAGFVEMPVVEVVVHEGDVFPLLATNAAFFAGELAH